MRINKPKAPKPRTKPVKFGEKSHGRRKLIQAVMERGFSYRTALKAVDAVFRMWTQAIKDKDQNIEMPVGYIKVKKTPSHLYKKRHTRRVICGRPIGRLISWTTYNDLYRILWRMPADQ